MSREAILWWLFIASAAMFAMTPIVVGWLAVRLPPDYFSRRLAPSRRWPDHRGLQWAVAVGKNLLGVLLVLAGLVMLVMPGQGLLTMAMGVILLDFPGRDRLERWLIARKPILRSINWLRKKARCEPLKPPQGKP